MHARQYFFRRWGLLLLGLLIDVDHLLADPVYDPERCSIGFHPLHTAPALLLYCLLVAVPRLRLLGVGLVLHILLDALDCLTMPGGVDAMRAYVGALLWIH